MNFNDLFSFLTELQQNNHKEWMDANRKWYHQVRDSFMNWLDDLDISLAAIDPNYYPTPGKKGINRINNNLMFHPDKPIYKDHFGAGLDKRSKQGDFYVHIGIEESLLAGGYWKPDPKTLSSIRQAIDYDGEELIRILNKKSFKTAFGGLIEDASMLKKAPKGFSMEHPNIDLLRYKTFAVLHPLTKKEVLQEDFKDKIIEIYKKMLPFRRYLNKAVTV